MCIFFLFLFCLSLCSARPIRVKANTLSLSLLLLSDPRVAAAAAVRQSTDCSCLFLPFASYFFCFYFGSSSVEGKTVGWKWRRCVVSICIVWLALLLSCYGIFFLQFGRPVFLCSFWLLLLIFLLSLVCQCSVPLCSPIFSSSFSSSFPVLHLHGNVCVCCEVCVCVYPCRQIVRFSHSLPFSFFFFFFAAVFFYGSVVFFQFRL